MGSRLEDIQNCGFKTGDYVYVNNCGFKKYKPYKISDITSESDYQRNMGYGTKRILASFKIGHSVFMKIPIHSLRKLSLKETRKEKLKQL